MFGIGTYTVHICIEVSIKKELKIFLAKQNKKYCTWIFFLSALLKRRQVVAVSPSNLFDAM
jgi:hypothetical protein